MSESDDELCARLERENAELAAETESYRVEAQRLEAQLALHDAGQTETQLQIAAMEAEIEEVKRQTAELTAETERLEKRARFDAFMNSHVLAAFEHDWSRAPKGNLEGDDDFMNVEARRYVDVVYGLWREADCTQWPTIEEAAEKFGERRRFIETAALQLLGKELDRADSPLTVTDDEGTWRLVVEERAHKACEVTYDVQDTIDEALEQGRAYMAAGDPDPFGIEEEREANR